ncbi:MAG: KGG domain-containing protein [Pyrinomonadaceae bacterium]
MIKGRTMRKNVGTSSRGFASMDAEKQREIARKGGLIPAALTSDSVGLCK